MQSLLWGAGLLLLGSCCAQHAVPGDLEPLDAINENEFEKYFHLPPVNDPTEFKRRRDALKKNEEDIKKTNEAYEAGKKSWFDGLNSFDDLPEDEFLAMKTGSITPGLGLLEPLPEERIDEESERFLDQFRYNRASAPASYSSVAMGYVSPVKAQKNCGSCVAFASVATIETCFKMITNVFGDYSEQQLVDCGFGKNNANGCKGAAPHAYLDWAGKNNIQLAHESQYPYLDTDTKYSCPAKLPVYNQGAKINGSYYTYSGDEELLKNLVYTYGAVVATVKATGPFENYKGGIFSGCTDTNTDHAITVVGYGSEGGQDYWLIKNSWSETWGENGFIRLKRGVGMCGIGSSIAAVTCTKTTGPTDAPLTTKKPCIDQWSDCPDLAQTSCWEPEIEAGCSKSCGLCPGLTPVQSNTCYNKYSNCDKMAPYCSQDNIKAGCKKACKLC